MEVLAHGHLATLVPVPKAAVDKNGDALFHQNNIRTHGAVAMVEVLAHGHRGLRVR
jgi:hypothetical protein